MIPLTRNTCSCVGFARFFGFFLFLWHCGWNLLVCFSAVWELRASFHSTGPWQLPIPCWAQPPPVTSMGVPSADTNQDQSFFPPLIFATCTSPSYHILQSVIGTDTVNLQFIHVLVFLCVFSWSDIGPQKHPVKRKLKHRNFGKFRFYSLTKVL